MSKPFFVRYESPEGLEKEALDALDLAAQSAEDTGAIRKGTNETTKAIERGIAQLVYIALDTDPPEIVGHLPLLCNEKKVPYVYISKKEEIGKACGMQVKCASCAVVDPGDARDQIKKIGDRVRELAGIK